MKRSNKSQKKKVVTLVGDGVLHLWAFVTLVGVVTFVSATSSSNERSMRSALKGLILAGINFRLYYFSRVLVLGQIRENTRKLKPVNYTRTADSQKFGKVNPCENVKLPIREISFP